MKRFYLFFKVFIFIILIICVSIVTILEVNSASNKKIKDTLYSSSLTSVSEKTNTSIGDNSNGKEMVSPRKPFKASYHLSDKGEDVMALQQDLNNYGYKIKADGVFGDSTYFAVINLQSKLGSSIDGIIGTETIKVLEKTPAPALLYKTIAGDTTSTSPLDTFVNSQSLSSKTDYYIWVDSSNFKVNIFSGFTGAWHLVKSVTCSMGAAFTPTCKGHFEIGGRGPMFSAGGGIICKYFTQFNGNFLFHTILLDSAGVPVDSRLGYGISHGCIRLAIEDAKFIYENIPTGTAVWVK